MCEELGSGWDKIADEIETFHLPAPNVEVIDDCTRITIYAHRPLSEIDYLNRIRSVYLHACLTYISTGDGINESTVQQPFDLSDIDKNQVTQLLNETVNAGDIVVNNPHIHQPNAEYIPLWAIHSEKDQSE